jgi:hypothetical protein
VIVVEDQKVGRVGWAIRDVNVAGHFSGWQVTHDGLPISGLFEQRRWAEAALTELRDETRIIR